MMTRARALMDRLADQGFTLVAKDGAIDVYPGDLLRPAEEQDLIELRDQILLWLDDPMLAAILERAENDPPHFPADDWAGGKGAAIVRESVLVPLEDQGRPA